MLRLRISSSRAAADWVDCAEGVVNRDEIADMNREVMVPPGVLGLGVTGSADEELPTAEAAVARCNRLGVASVGVVIEVILLLLHALRAEPLLAVVPLLWLRVSGVALFREIPRADAAAAVPLNHPARPPRGLPSAAAAAAAAVLAALVFLPSPVNGICSEGNRLWVFLVGEGVRLLSVRGSRLGNECCRRWLICPEKGVGDGQGGPRSSSVKPL